MNLIEAMEETLRRIREDPPPVAQPTHILVSGAEYDAMVALGGPSMENYLRIHGVNIDAKQSAIREMRVGAVKAFRSLSWAFHEPGGHVLWWLIKNSGRLHILSELAFEHLPEAELAAAMKARDLELRLEPRFGIKDISYTVGTPEIVSDIKPPRTGICGQTIGDTLLSYGVPILAADPDALNGWQRCQSLLRVDETGKPTLTIDPSCKVLSDAIRSGLQDDTHPEDIDTPAPALLALRYGAMTWPAVDQVTPIQTIPVGSPAWYMQQARQGESRRFGQVH